MGTPRWTVWFLPSLRWPQFAGLTLGLYGLWQAAAGGCVCWEQWERDGRLPLDASGVGLSVASVVFGGVLVVLAPFLWRGHSWARVGALGVCLWLVGLAALWALEPLGGDLPLSKQVGLRVSGVGVYGLAPAAAALFLVNARVRHEFRGGLLWLGRYAQDAVPGDAPDRGRI